MAEERLRIARDLHDTVAHQIAVINLQSSVASRAIAEGREPDLVQARDSLDTVGRASRGVLREIRELLSVLRTGPDDDAPTSPQAGLADLDRLVEEFSTAGLAVDVRREETSPSSASAATLPPSTDRTAYLVLREALANAHKHGTGARAHVLIERDAHRLRLTVTNPVPLDPRPEASSRPDAQLRSDDADRTGGLGLIGLRERVLAVRGEVEIESRPGLFRLCAVLPLDRPPISPREESPDDRTHPHRRRSAPDPPGRPGPARRGARSRRDRRGRRRPACGRARRTPDPGRRADGHPHAGGRRDRGHPADRRGPGARRGEG